MSPRGGAQTRCLETSYGNVISQGGHAKIGSHNLDSQIGVCYRDLISDWNDLLLDIHKIPIQIEVNGKL